ncbi:histone-lysine N-methyltransferase set-1-like isoform X2 [Clarias gariepinus]|nr:histone-lysine N-methyltransferase set-1-like isoform X2 [Clarias gariepinus]
MMMRRRRRRKPSPLEEATTFSLKKKEQDGLEARFINEFKGRGVFSCTDFDKGDFLLEYRGDLISREECERRRRIYHDALKVFMYEFRFNGKFLCVDAALDDGSLGRLVNDDHLKPNCRMKTIRVDGKPHLCLFAIRSICPGEEITYNYGDSEWPWRCKMTSSKNSPPPEQKDTADKKASKKCPISELPSDSAACEELTVVTDEVTLGMAQLSSEKQNYIEKNGGEKVYPVKESLVKEELSFCLSTQGLEQVRLCDSVKPVDLMLKITFLLVPLIM